MACCDSKTDLTPEEQFGIAAGTPCTAITVDLLQVYKKSIDCYLEYGIWVKIESNQDEMQNASSYLQTLINQKIADPNNCTGIELLYLVRALVHKIVKVGACL